MFSLLCRAGILITSNVVKAKASSALCKETKCLVSSNSMQRKEFNKELNYRDYLPLLLLVSLPTLRNNNHKFVHINWKGAYRCYNGSNHGLGVKGARNKIQGSNPSKVSGRIFNLKIR